jgi:hypothetical protein
MVCACSSNGRPCRVSRLFGDGCDGGRVHSPAHFDTDPVSSQAIANGLLEQRLEVLDIVAGGPVANA